MTLPTKVIDRLFERLSATYGAGFTAMWRDVPMESVKAAWAHELAGFAGRLEALAYALEHLPERAPNAIEFRNLARLAPPPPAPALPMPTANPERVRAALAAARTDIPPRQDPTAWARRIIERAEAGQPVSHGSLSIARAALTRSIAA